MKSSAPQDDIYRLEVLSEDEALKLLETLAPKVVAEQRAECRKLVRELEGLPLALQVAGRMLRAEHERGWNVVRLLADLRVDTAKLLNAQAPADMARPGDVSPSVTALLCKSTDCLDVTTRKRFSHLAPFAPRPAVFELGDIAAVWDVNEALAEIKVSVPRVLLPPYLDRQKTPASYCSVKSIALMHPLRMPLANQKIASPIYFVIHNGDLESLFYSSTKSLMKHFRMATCLASRRSVLEMVYIARARFNSYFLTLLRHFTDLSIKLPIEPSQYFTGESE